MSVVAVIPARGGSKGVPGKNVAAVGGHPLVSRAVAAARHARYVDRVLVSTDDRLVAEAAREAGAEVVERPANRSPATRRPPSRPCCMRSTPSHPRRSSCCSCSAPAPS